MKIAMPTTITPQTHYSSYLAKELSKLADLEVYCDKKENPLNPGFKVKKVWKPGINMIWQILRQSKKDKIRLSHVQHEFNMYGGISGVISFPILLSLLKLNNIKTVVTLHAVVKSQDVDDTFLRTFNYPSNLIFKYLVKAGFTYLYSSTLLLSDKIIVHSNKIKDDLRSYSSVDKVISIHHGVPDNETYKVHHIDEPFWNKIKQKKVILSFGYITGRKGIEYLIEGFADIAKKHPDWVLVFAGGLLKGQEYYYNHLKKIILYKGIGNQVIFTGFLKKKESISDLFNYSEIVALPAKYSIAGSGPLAQAIGYQKPIILNNIGAFSKEITDNSECLFVSPKNSKDWSKKLELLINDPKMRLELSKNITKRKRQRQWSKIAGQTLKIYKEVNSGG